MSTPGFIRARVGRLAWAGLVVWGLALAASPLSATAAAVTAAQAQSGATASPQDIRDIRPPYPLPQSWLWIGCLAGAAGLTALGIGLWQWRRSRMPHKTLQELTLERLEQTRPLLESGDVRAFSVVVSEILRAYVEERFKIRALHRTTLEFLRDCLASRESPLRPHEKTLSDFLTYCDLAKFARWTLTVAEMDSMLEVAKTLVRETAPVAASSGDVPVATAYAS